jgi:hypothetical protein
MEIVNLKQRVDYLMDNVKVGNILLTVDSFIKCQQDINEYIEECKILNNQLEKNIELQYIKHVEDLINDYLNEKDFIYLSLSNCDYKNNLFTVTLNKEFYDEVLQELFDLYPDLEKDYDLIEDYFFMNQTSKIEIDIKNSIITNDTQWRYEKIKQLAKTMVIPNRQHMIETDKYEIKRIKSNFIKRYFERDNLESYKNRIVESERIISFAMDLTNPEYIHPFFKVYNKKLVFVVDRLKEAMYHQTGKEFFVQL